MPRIPIACRTNLDEYKREEWATELPAVPHVGQLMQSQSGKVLSIVATTWRPDGTLLVELHGAYSVPPR